MIGEIRCNTGPPRVFVDTVQAKVWSGTSFKMKIFGRILSCDLILITLTQLIITF